MRVLVTGAAGCLGRAVGERLRAHGHEPVGLDRMAAPTGALPHYASWFRVDLPEDDPIPALAECEAVVHLAALVHRPDLRDADAYHRANVIATESLLTATSAAGIEPGRFVLSSTVSVYGRDHDLTADEETDVAPRTPYAISKLEAETRVREAGGKVLRFPVAYGPGDRGNVARLIEAIRRGRFVLPGPCREPRSLVAAANAGESFVRALEGGASGGLYLVTDDDDASVSRLVEAILKAMPKARRPPRIPLAVLWPPAAIGTALEALGLGAPLTLEALRKLTSRLTFSCERAKRELGYRPIVDLDEGIRRSLTVA